MVGLRMSRSLLLAGDMIKSYRDLIVWQKSMALVVEIYRLTRKLPTREQFGIVSQLQRAAISIPANVAEGHSRGSRGDYRRHVSVARGSLAEMETHLELTWRLGLLPQGGCAPAESLANEVGRMLSTLLYRLKQPSASARRIPGSLAP
jgi:four helix bundle protein